MPAEVKEKLSADLSGQVIPGEQSNKSSVRTMWQHLVCACNFCNKTQRGMFLCKCRLDE